MNPVIRVSGTALLLLLAIKFLAVLVAPLLGPLIALALLVLVVAFIWELVV